MGEIFFIALTVGTLVGWSLFLKKTGRIYWLITMSLCMASVIGMEIFSTATTGITISRHYWNWSLDHEAQSWMVASIMLIGWINLIIHLQWKVIKRRFIEKK